MSLVEIRLDDVGRRIHRRIPDLDDKITAGDVDEADVIQVEADAVLRLVRNRDGYLSETNGNYTYMFRQDLANGKLEILATEWETLGVVTGSVFQLVRALAMRRLRRSIRSCWGVDRCLA